MQGRTDRIVARRVRRYWQARCALSECRRCDRPVSAIHVRRCRPDDADEEVLETCRELQQFTGKQVTLVTGDVASHLLAQPSGIAAIEPPAEYQRVPDATDG